MRRMHRRALRSTTPFSSDRRRRPAERGPPLRRAERDHSRSEPTGGTDAAAVRERDRREMYARFLRDGALPMTLRDRERREREEYAGALSHAATDEQRAAEVVGR